MTGQRKSRDVDRSLVGSTIHEQAHGNNYPSSEDQTAALEEEQAAAEVLRKHLKAVLRPDFSSDGLHQIEMMQCGEEESRPASVESRRTNSCEKMVKRMPSMGIRKVSSQWDSENPFQVSPTGSEAGLVGLAESDTHHIVSRHVHDGSAEQEDDEADTGSFIHVALASTSAPSAEYQTRLASSTIKSHPVSAMHSSCSVHNRSATLSSLASDSTRPSTNKRPISNHGGSGPPLVVARAACELAHPRPSRSSESRMLRVLCKEKEGSAEQQRAGQALRTGRQHSVPSQESTTSFHTAQQTE